MPKEKQKAQPTYPNTPPNSVNREFEAALEDCQTLDRLLEIYHKLINWYDSMWGGGQRPEGVRIGDYETKYLRFLKQRFKTVKPCVIRAVYELEFELLLGDTAFNKQCSYHFESHIYPRFQKIMQLTIESLKTIEKACQEPTIEAAVVYVYKMLTNERSKERA